MRGNTWPKLWEVSYGRASQHNKNFLAMNSLVPFHTYKLKTRTPQWFPDPQCRTLDRQPKPSGPTTWHHNRDRQIRKRVKTETDEDEDRLTLGTSEVAAPLQLTTPQSDEDRGRRRWRHLKMKTDSHWGRAKWHLPYSWWQSRVTKTELDTSLLMWPADSQAHEGCSSLCSSRSSRGTAPVIVPELAFRKTNGYEELTVPSGCANWSDRRLTTRLSALQPKLNDILSSSFLTVLGALSIYIFLGSVKAQHIWLADHIKQTVNTVLVGQSFHNILSHCITFPSMQNG